MDSKETKLLKHLPELAAYRKNGLIAQADGDMGDTLNREGMLYSCLAALGVERDYPKVAFVAVTIFCQTVHQDG
jgi:hypothetical protein